MTNHQTALDRAAPQWTYEVHQLSEGFSACVYDQHGDMIADFLTEEHARVIAASPDILRALQDLVNSLEKQRPKEYWDAARAALAAIAKATGAA